MAATPIRRVIPHLRRSLGSDVVDAPDGPLLDRFVGRRDDEAFEALVRRHGPMVLGVCRRVLGNEADAEDAFQATFLVLARRAASLSTGRGLANWLYGVAYRSALKARALATRRRGRERSVTELPDREAPAGDDWDDLLLHLDAELSRLPPIYREAVVMCDLEGLTQKDAASRAGCPEGTLSSRLTRARALLARRLTRLGIALAGGVLGMALAREGAARTIPPGLVRTTVEAATRLGTSPAAGLATSKAVLVSEGVMKSMLLGKLKAIATGATLVGALLTALVLLRPTGEAGGQEKPRPADPPTAAPIERLPAGFVMRLGVADRQTAEDQVAITADGKSIVGVRAGKYVRVWDRATGLLREVTKLPIEWPRSVAVLSTDGRLLLTDGVKHDGVVLWDIGQRKQLTEWVMARGQQLYIHVAFSPDLKQVAAIGSGSKRHHVRVWDVASGKEVFSHDVDVVASAGGPYFSADGKHLMASFSSAERGTTRWDLANGRVVWQNKEFCPNHLVEAADGRVYPSETHYPVLDAATGKSVGTPPEWHGRLIRSPDGNTVLATDGLGVAAWDVAQRTVRKFAEAKGPIALSPDGKTFVSSRGRLQCWDVDSGKALFADNSDQGHVDEAMALAFGADGKGLVSVGLDQTVRIWNLTSGKQERVFRPGEARPPMPLHLARALNTEILYATPDGRRQVRQHLDDLSVWDAKSDKLVTKLDPAVEPVPGLNGGRILHAWMNADGSRVFAILPGTGATTGGAVFVGQPRPMPTPGAVVTWNGAGKIIDRRPIDLDGRKTELSPDGRWLLEDGALIWTETGKKSHRLEGVKEAGSSVPYVFSPDGGLILGGASRHVVKDGQNWSYPDGMKVWETVTGKLVAHFQSDNWAIQIRFHPGGRYVAVSVIDGVQVWDLLTGKTVADRKMPERVHSKVGGGFAACAAISPDARRLATGVADGSILIWEINRPDEAVVALNPQVLDQLWADLDSTDTGKAWTAVRKLAAAPAAAVPFLGERVKPVPNAPADQTRALIARLDSDDFREREAAVRKLKVLGAKAEAALRAALAVSRSAEQARRIDDLLAQLEKVVEPATAELRDVRAVAVLRLAGTDQSKTLLRELAKGVDRAPLTREARAALAALDGQ